MGRAFYWIGYMIKLFTYEGSKMTVDAEAILLQPFKVIWERDKSKTKDLAMMELGFIYFMCDPRSDYQFIVNPKEREEEIKRGEGLPEEWRPDELLEDAMKFYSSFKPTASALLEDTNIAVDKVRAFLRDIDLYATDDKGKPIYTINSVTSAIKLIPSLVRDLHEAEKAIKSEIASNAKARGSISKSILEDV